MPVPGTNISSENILGMLFKKNEHVVNTNPTGSVAGEPLTNARPRIFPTEQLIAQPIPKNDIIVERNLVLDANYSQRIQGGSSINSHAKRFVNSTYPYIAKYYRILLTPKIQGVSYFYSSNGTSNFVEAENILTDTIPITYDTNYTYKIIIEFFMGGNFYEIAPNDDVYPWILDTDGGIVTFYFNPPITGVQLPVYISFWRYEGTKGITAASASNKLEPTVTLPNRNTFTFSNELGINNSAGNPDTITTAFAKMDDWFFTNMISQPPAPTKIGEYRKTTEVGVIFSGPQQLYLLDMHVPVIKGLSTDIVTTASTQSQTITALNKNSSFIPPTNKVDGIVISKLPGNSGIETRTTTQNGTQTPYNVYVYYNPALASNPTFTLNIWYSNDSSYPVNKLSVPNLSFETAYPPSEPLTVIPNTLSITDINISWTQPLHVMYDQATNTQILTTSTTDTTIQNYLVTSTPSSTPRYPGLFNNTANIIVPTTTSTQLTQLLPGTTYNINVKARNTANPNYGPASANFQATTNLPSLLNLPPANTIFNTSLTNGTIAQVGGTAPIQEPVFIEGETPISNFYNSIPVHTQENAGSSAVDIATLELTNNMKSLLTKFSGFPAKTYSDASSQELEITNIITSDLYTPAEFKGFYLRAQARFKLKNLPDASPTQQTVIINANTNPYSRRYYVEKPQAGDPTLLFNPIQLPQTKLISGIPTIGNTAANKNIKCYIDASNIGTYFYRNSGIFYIYGTPYITPYTQTTLPPSVTAPITGTVPFTVDLPLNITSPTDYARGFTMKAKAHNGVKSGVEQTVPVPLLIDSASYNATFPSTPPDPTNGFVTGMRCVTAAPDVEPVPGTLQPTNITHYDISNILTSLDLPYLHGKYQVRDSLGNTNTDFVDYGPYGSDLTPLQAETGFRWVTYAWKIPASSKYIKELNINLKEFTNTLNLKYNTANNKLEIFNGTAYSPNDVFKVYYRIEDSVDIATSNSNSLSTVWLNANEKDPNGNINYINNNDKQNKTINGIYNGLLTILSIGSTPVPSDLIYKVIVPSLVPSSYINIYVRVGIKMDAYGLSFKTVQCQYIG